MKPRYGAEPRWAAFSIRRRIPIGEGRDNSGWPLKRAGGGSRRGTGCSHYPGAQTFQNHPTANGRAPTSSVEMGTRRGNQRLVHISAIEGIKNGRLIRDYSTTHTLIATPGTVQGNAGQRRRPARAGAFFSFRGGGHAPRTLDDREIFTMGTRRGRSKAPEKNPLFGLGPPR